MGTGPRIERMHKKNNTSQKKKKRIIRIIGTATKIDAGKEYL